MLDRWLLVTGLLAVVVAATSRRLDRALLSEPMMGLLVGIALGPVGIGLLEAPRESLTDLLSQVARLTLAVALMAVALRYPIDAVRRSRRRVLWLIALVLPGMALIGTLLAWAVLGIGLGLAAALGAAVAPTDPVLASSVVSGEEAEESLPDSLRRALSLESGFNDGLAGPMVLLAGTTAIGAALAPSVLHAVWSAVGAVLVGGLVGYATAAWLSWARRRHDVDASHRLTFSLVLSFGVLGLATMLRLDGLLTVFITGLAFNYRTTGQERRVEQPLDEAVNRFLILPLFLLVGVALPWDRWIALGWRIPVFVVTVLAFRRLPLVAMIRRPLRCSRPDATWLGWFGPIGAAAVYYLTHLDQRGVTDEIIWTAGSACVAASILAHGATASPARRWYVTASTATSTRRRTR